MNLTASSPFNVGVALIGFAIIPVLTPIYLNLTKNERFIYSIELLSLSND